jgi:hypothetical protein
MHGGSMMSVRLRRFEPIQKQKVELLERILIDFKKAATDLAAQIADEEQCTGNKDTEHFAYSTFAKAAALRRRNLMNSVTDVESKLDVAKRELYEVTLKLRNVELAQNETASRRSATANESQRTRRPSATVDAAVSSSA